MTDIDQRIIRDLRRQTGSQIGRIEKRLDRSADKARIMQSQIADQQKQLEYLYSLIRPMALASGIKIPMLKSEDSKDRS